jgi:hypothetical protein
MNIRCDIFCSVVDNLGDAGVCWRLARQLAARRPWRIRLWIDDLRPLAGLHHGIDAGLASQSVADIDIRRWASPFPEIDTADVVIEAFACTLPPAYIDRMASRQRPPAWINLEYLSAEPWVIGCHAQASPHPTLPLVKHFFFPGFMHGTGGLLDDTDGNFVAEPPATPLSVSLFCYENPALPSLLHAWEQEKRPILCHVADGLPRQQVERWLGVTFPVGAQVQREMLTLSATPFVPQDEFDLRLSSCALNFVRGEDSFVRAQWAGRPFVWHIYPQAERAHMTKLAAFLDCYLASLPIRDRETIIAFWQAWNVGGNVSPLWPAFRDALPMLSAHAACWPERLRLPGNLAENLASFCEERL